jgi:NAD(P)-dependent dehydrogenase (short-subunit alcohol dehydrogenase family)
MTILVTGGGGYIGSHMVHELHDAGEAVVVIDDLSTGFRSALPKTVPLVIGDVGDGALTADLIRTHDVTAIIHFAASIVVPDSVRDPLGYYRNNTMNARALFEAATRHVRQDTVLRQPLHPVHRRRVEARTDGDVQTYRGAVGVEGAHDVPAVTVLGIRLCGPGMVQSERMSAFMPYEFHAEAVATIRNHVVETGRMIVLTSSQTRAGARAAIGQCLTLQTPLPAILSAKPHCAEPQPIVAAGGMVVCSAGCARSGDARPVVGKVPAFAAPSPPLLAGKTRVVDR